MKKPRKKWRLFFLIMAVLLISGIWISVKLVSKANQIFTNQQNPLVRLGKFLISEDKGLIGDENGKINILLLGYGGEGHDGPLLTDTMIIAQIDTQTSEAVMISIPRDFGVTSPSLGLIKINAAFAYAEAAKRGAGGPAAIEAVEKITGLQIPYFIAVDFKGFERAIDYVGGVEVVVDRTFTDAQFPDSRYGYLPPLTFTKGPEHMNGIRALQFVRSRHGNNNEGSDFARSERQKKIITAFAERVDKLNLTEFRTMNNLLSAFTDHLRTNMEPHELKKLGELGRKISAERVYSLSLEPGRLICDGIVEYSTGRMVPQKNGENDNGDNEKELVPEVVRMYVLRPCEGKTIADIHDHLKHALTAARLRDEKAVIHVQNSTGNSNALREINEFADFLDIRITTFTARTPYERTILYDNSGGKFPRTAEFLRSNLNFTKADIPYPNSTADFVIVIGQDML